MRYLLIYRGYPKKSLQDVTTNRLNKMPEEERAKYIQVPMTGTLEEVLRGYIEQNGINKRDVRVLANAFGLNADDLFRPDLRSENSRYKGSGVPAWATVSTETKKKIQKFADREKLPSLDEAVDRLIVLGLEKAGI